MTRPDTGASWQVPARREFDSWRVGALSERGAAYDPLEPQNACQKPLLGIVSVMTRPGFPPGALWQAPTLRFSIHGGSGRGFPRVVEVRP